jgi:hypothetical protein
MALKRSGTPALLRNVRWAGREPFDAFQFTVTSGGFAYTFVVPKICGNISLLSTVPVAAVARSEPAYVPPPPPPEPEPAPAVEAPAPAPPPLPPLPAPAAPAQTNADHWFASGYLGSNFGGAGSVALTNLSTGRTLNINNNGSNVSVNFGGELGYAFGGKFGAEFMANYSPNFTLGDTLLQRRPAVSAYMFNALAALPMLEEHRFSPFISGGIGWVHLASTIFTVDPTTTNVNINSLTTTNVGGSEFGWDLGGGLMAFNGPWGLRADVRYYRAANNNTFNDTTVNGLFLHRALDGISFWNANLGLVFRW